MQFKYVLPLIVLGLFNLFSENILLDYDNFETSNIQSPVDPTGPNSITFDNDGTLYVTNPLRREIVSFSSTYQFNKIIGIKSRELFGLYFGNISSKKNYLIGYCFYNLSYLDRDSNNTYSIDIQALSGRFELRQKSYYVTPDYFFHYLKDGGIICIPNPGMDNAENLSKILVNEEVLALFEPGSGYDMDGLIMDEKYRIFRDGELMNRDYYNWMDYWMDQYGYEDPRDFNKDSNHQVIPLWRNGYHQSFYMGEDSIGYNYWKSLAGYVYIFNHRGWCVREIECPNTPFIPTVHPNGDIYFMQWSREQNTVELSRIENTWAPFDWQPPAEFTSTNSTAKVTANGLRMRDNPATSNSTVIASLNQGTIVKILGQSATEETIGGKSSYWYRVRTIEGLDGWVFGAFLELQ